MSCQMEIDYWIKNVCILRFGLIVRFDEEHVLRCSDDIVNV